MSRIPSRWPLWIAGLCLAPVSAFAFGKKPPRIPQPIPSYTMLRANPMSAPVIPGPGDVSYSVNVKFINHGLKDIPAETIPRLVHAVEVIYSQCPGVDFHVNVVGNESAPYTTDQDDVTEFSKDGALAFGDGFQKFYSRFPNSPDTGRIDVDLVDDLSAQVRNAEAQGDYGESFLGQAFEFTIMDNLYEDLRSPQYREQGPPSSIGGNTIRLGMETLRIAESTAGPPFHINELDQNDQPILDSAGNEIPVVAWRGYQSSLLAHEMGHILMDPQSGKGSYIDHYCPDLGVTCPEGYLMSSGGFTDRHFLRVPQMDRVIGYSPLPLVDKGQCETLIHHPLVKREN